MDELQKAAQIRLMDLVEHFLRVQLVDVSRMLDTHAADAKHKLSVQILNELLRQKGNLSEAEITRRGGTMKDWWSTDPKWRHVLVFQFNFHVLMPLFDVCYKNLPENNVYHRFFSQTDLDNFRRIQTGLSDYILSMEKREDYRQEIGDTKTWLLGYGVGLEHAQLISEAGAEEGIAASGRKNKGVLSSQILKLKEELKKRDDKVLQLKEKLDELDDDVQRERSASSRMMKTLDETSRELEIVSVQLQKTNIELQEEKKKNRELNALLLEQSERPDDTRRVYLQGRCWN
jgi:hypothetical protein